MHFYINPIKMHLTIYFSSNYSRLRLRYCSHLNMNHNYLSILFLSLADAFSINTSLRYCRYYYRLRYICILPKFMSLRLFRVQFLVSTLTALSVMRLESVLIKQNAAIIIWVMANLLWPKMWYCCHQCCNGLIINDIT